MGIPVVILAGLIIIFTYVFRDNLFPGTPVNYIVAVAVPAQGNPNSSGTQSGGVSSDQMLFQATGWIEPDPLPVRATTLFSGIVDKVHVLEGESVTRGQPLATLIQDDIKLVLRRAESQLAQAQASEDSLNAKWHLMLKRIETATHKHQIELTQLAEFQDVLKRIESVKKGTIPEKDLVTSQLQAQKQSSKVAAAAAEIDEWKAEAQWVQKQIEVQKQLIASAEVARDEAQLALARTVITAPIDGIILRLHASPGKRLMLSMDAPDSASAAILFNPSNLQVRVDVPLSDAGKLVIGQNVRINCSLLPNKEFSGSVTRIAGEADLQRNTLQAKVQIKDPDPRLRPEMLCRAEFFSLPSRESANHESPPETGPLTVYLPMEALTERSEHNAKVWIISPDNNHTQSRMVKLGSSTKEGLIPIHNGIRPGERVIISPPASLKNGMRVIGHKVKP